MTNRGRHEDASKGDCSSPSVLPASRLVSKRQRNPGVPVRWVSVAVVSGLGAIFPSCRLRVHANRDMGQAKPQAKDERRQKRAECRVLRRFTIAGIPGRWSRRRRQGRWALADPPSSTVIIASLRLAGLPSFALPVQLLVLSLTRRSFPWSILDPYPHSSSSSLYLTLRFTLAFQQEARERGRRSAQATRRTARQERTPIFFELRVNRDALILILPYRPSNRIAHPSSRPTDRLRGRNEGVKEEEQEKEKEKEEHVEERSNALVDARLPGHRRFLPRLPSSSRRRRKTPPPTE
ncbi:hypothetical protein NMY22_g19212 [Coprinellus aureogranulatus]|nr:hypothetical protein NMY22_g19212 [Coprinellus aureogranulatus]